MYSKIKLLIKNILKLAITSVVISILLGLYPKNNIVDYTDSKELINEHPKPFDLHKVQSYEIQKGIMLGISSWYGIDNCCSKDSFTISLEPVHLYDSSNSYIEFDGSWSSRFTIKINKTNKQLFDLIRNSSDVPLRLEVHDIQIKQNTGSTATLDSDSSWKLIVKHEGEESNEY